jgi:hypothetical protein
MAVNRVVMDIAQCDEIRRRIRSLVFVVLLMVKFEHLARVVAGSPRIARE